MSGAVLEKVPLMGGELEICRFAYVTDQHCHTLLTCGLQRRQVPHGEHLTKKCRHWMVRREVEVGWCPEVA